MGNKAPLNANVPGEPMWQPEVALWRAVINQALDDIVYCTECIYRLRYHSHRLNRWIKRDLLKDQVDSDPWGALALLLDPDYETDFGLSSADIFSLAYDNPHVDRTPVHRAIIRLLEESWLEDPVRLCDIYYWTEYPSDEACRRRLNKNYCYDLKKAIKQIVRDGCDKYGGDAAKAAAMARHLDKIKEGEK